MLHELAHALGFVPNYWELFSLVGTGDDPHFKGDSAIAAFNAAGGTGYTGNKVPISPPDHSHWWEDVFGTELMSPTISASETNQLSSITLQAMADIGYTIDLSEADAFTVSLSDMALPDIPGEAIDLTDDVVMGPVMVVDSNGRILRVIPPPGGSVQPSFGDTVEVTDIVIDRREREKPKVSKRVPTSSRRGR